MKKNRLQIQKRTALEKALRKAENSEAGNIDDHLAELERRLKPRRVNQYTCGECGGVITTIDRDEGTTPMFLSCRATDGCDGRMSSSCYRVPKGLVPDHEWYKPDKLPREPGMRQHVQMGGLLIRRIEGDPWG